MAATTSGGGKDLGPEDFEAIREAVMETPRGRWFLGEMEARMRKTETVTLLDSMKRLESAVSHNHDAIMQRLAEALARGPHVSLPPSPSPQTELAPKHMKYFKQDEEIFEPAPQATIAAVPEPAKPAEVKKPAVAKGAKLIIRRTSAVETVDAVEVAETTIDVPHPPEPAEAVAVAAEQLAAPAEPAQAAQDAPQAEAAPKRRIVIIRHKPGEDIDVPLQDELAQAS